MGHVQVEDRAHRRRHEQRDEGDGEVGRRLPRVGPVADAQRDGERADPELAGGQRRADRPGVEHGAADIDAVVDAGEHEVGLGPDRPERAGDDREGGGGVEPVGLHRLGTLDVGPLVGDGRGIGHRADGGAGAAVVGAGRHHDDLVGRVAARPVGPGRQGPRQRCQSGGAHPVVVGDENPHGALTLPPVRRGAPGSVHPPFGSVSPGGHARPPGTPHPRRGPGLLQFTRNAGPLAQDLRRLAHRAAVAHRARPPGGHRLRGGRHPAGLQRRPDHGPRRLRRRRVVPLGPGSGARPLAQSPGRRPLRVQRGAGAGRAGRAGAPQRHPRPRALDALDAPDAAPEPALPPPAAPSLARLPVLPPPGDGVPRGPRRPDRHDAGAIAGAGPDPLRHRLPSLPGRRDRGRSTARSCTCRHATPSTRTSGGSRRGRSRRSRARSGTSPRRASWARWCSTRRTPRWSATRTAWPGRRSTLPGGVGGAALWVDPAFPYLMVYTGDTLGEVQRRRHAVAIEPMTCPPNAFRTGDDVIALAAGAGVDGPLGHRTAVSAPW